MGVELGGVECTMVGVCSSVVNWYALARCMLTGTLEMFPSSISRVNPTHWHQNTVTCLSTSSRVTSETFHTFSFPAVLVVVCQQPAAAPRQKVIPPMESSALRCYMELRNERQFNTMMCCFGK